MAENLLRRFDRANELNEDPLHGFLIWLKLLPEMMADLPTGHPGCLVASYCYQERLFDKNVTDLSASAVLSWRERFRALSILGGVVDRQRHVLLRLKRRDRPTDPDNATADDKKPEGSLGDGGKGSIFLSIVMFFRQLLSSANLHAALAVSFFALHGFLSGEFICDSVLLGCIYVHWVL
ncbi:MAG: hypothetical protein HOB79_18480 [Rhodospirillaceae bacterium]|nr:hypothetical protein [Rhodospirillaceae bacterium]MBT7486565.1 hypothetical protein [Rhodospirillales bacterium]MBT4703064.1 hypothetical protein [Rhodospirillaceae bacterium]MBT5034233.1 hypothetical protein [Rhodospirillaceae bacterium]MBT6218194.1 hypothetical protein [Rhodospirillaceae bacterium]